MKTIISTKTTGEITISSVFKGDKEWKMSGSHQQNWNNHLVTVTNNKKKFSFEFWGSIQILRSNQIRRMYLHCIVH
jgi:hypothetical protein